MQLFRYSYSCKRRYVTATGGNTNTKVAYKNCAPFTRCVTHINNEHIDNAESLNIIMPKYNFIEYSDNYSDSSGGLWKFKRDESPVTNAGSHGNSSTDNSTNLKYKPSFLEESSSVGNNWV